MVVMIAGLNDANYWPTLNVPTLKCQVASFEVDGWKKMFVRVERHGHSR
jgi:hypothetical protein